MSTSDSIETTAATVDEAVKQALEQLGAVEDDVVIEVLSTPRSGVLGLGVRAARVRVTRRRPEAARSGVTSPPRAPAAQAGRSYAPPAPQEAAAKAASAAAPSPSRAEQESEAVPDEGPQPARSTADLAEQAREASRVLDQILQLMGEKAEVRSAGADPEGIELEIRGDGSGILIGRHGQTLDALEYLVNRIVARRIMDAAPVTLDTEAYRQRRRRQLERMALQMGEQAKREHQTVRLEPMPPRDRRIIHLALKDDPMLTTRSSGTGFLREVEIVPVGGERPRPRGRGADKPREREPVGQQGGFKHGQKRIV